MRKHRCWRCVDCRCQVSLTAGTVLHNTKISLTVWFWAAYLMTTDKRGISALLLQQQLGLCRYETAWMLLHKLRRAMVNLGVGAQPFGCDEAAVGSLSGHGDRCGCTIST